MENPHSKPPAFEFPDVLPPVVVWYWEGIQHYFNSTGSFNPPSYEEIVNHAIELHPGELRVSKTTFERARRKYRKLMPTPSKLRRAQVPPWMVDPHLLDEFQDKAVTTPLPLKPRDVPAPAITGEFLLEVTRGDGTILVVSDLFCECVRYKREDLLGKQAWPMFNPDYDMTEIEVEVLRQVRQLRAGARDKIDADLRIRASDGTLVYFQQNAYLNTETDTYRVYGTPISPPVERLPLKAEDAPSSGGDLMPLMVVGAIQVFVNTKTHVLEARYRNLAAVAAGLAALPLLDIVSDGKLNGVIAWCHILLPHVHI